MLYIQLNTLFKRCRYFPVDSISAAVPVKKIGFKTQKTASALKPDGKTVSKRM